MDELYLKLAVNIKSPPRSLCGKLKIARKLMEMLFT